MNKILFRTLLALFTLALTACVNEPDITPTSEGGCLQLSLSNISTAVTRTTPTDLGRPNETDFHLLIVNAAGRAVYDKEYTENKIELPTGRYDVTVSYGRNAMLAIDAPYYIGTAGNVEIKKDETTTASITAKVANALVSVNFGKDAEERARFDRFYSDYSLQVYVGNHYMNISKDNSGKSVYVQDGCHVTLKFWGKLKHEDNREVSCVLESDDLPNELKAADHVIVTLSLPDPESDILVDISKTEIETASLDETIPLSWLPVPTLTPSLQFNTNGELVGTLLTSTDGYPGMNWRAVVTNAAGVEVRTMQGTGVLTSDYTSSSTWPYLPQGKYKATYYIISDDGTSKQASSREFVIPAPTGLEVKVDGYSSYTKYLENDIDAANECDSLTIYEPSVSVNISPSLLQNSKYSYTFTYTYDGKTESVTSGHNSYGVAKIENQPVRSTPYVLKANVNFDGVQIEGQKDFLITGLPALYAPPSESTGWSAGSDYVTFSENEVKLGERGWMMTHYNEFIKNSNFYIPLGTYIAFDYYVMIHPATEGTSLTFYAGDDVIISLSEEGGAANTKDYPKKSETSVIKRLTGDVKDLVCRNSYGGGETRSYIYSIYYKYGNP
jgi:hypothetical protein